MMKTIAERFRGRSLTVWLLVFPCALIGATPGASQQNATGPAGDDAGTLLNSLRQRLDRVALARARNLKFDIRDVEPAPISVTSLIGVSRQRLLENLGPSSVDCRRTLNGQTPAPVRRIAPCRAGDDLAYSFYALPKTWVGGGSELLLEFDGGDTCVRARWFQTQ
jgi:hypothetical protein